MPSFGGSTEQVKLCCSMSELLASPFTWRIDDLCFFRSSAVALLLPPQVQDCFSVYPYYRL